MIGEAEFARVRLARARAARDLLSNLGAELRRRLVERHLTVAEAAREAGVSSRTFQMIMASESGYRGVRFENIQALVRWLAR